MGVSSGGWLIDKSALVRLATSVDAETWSNRIERGLVRISNVMRLEVGYSARTGEAARREFREPPLVALPIEYLTPAIEDRALKVQLSLADRGMHRGPSIPDLIIAATAELAGLSPARRQGFRRHRRCRRATNGATG